MVESQPVEEVIHVLSTKINQLKREYEQYFLGTRPRPPVLLRGEVHKTMAYLTNQPMPNTAMRFKFSSLCSRYQSFKRQWDETLRKIEAGTYERHVFKAEKMRRPVSDAPSAPKAGVSRSAEPDLFESYRDARLACGESTKGLSRDKLESQLQKQKAQLTKKFGEDARFQFRVAVEKGKVRLKAKRLREA